MPLSLSSADISIFSREIRNFCYIKKYIYILNFDTEFLILLFLFESLKVILINIVAIWKMSPKLATLGLLKITVFWIKGDDVIIFVCDVTNKIFSGDSNYTLDVFKWHVFKFGICRISMRKIIITLKTQFKMIFFKKAIFWGLLLFKVQ